MLALKKVFSGTLKWILILYILLCVGLYFFQEKLIFFPGKLDSDYKFSFGQQKFEEINITAKDGKLINYLLFEVDNARRTIFYLHGNAGALNDWGFLAERYTALQYNVFILDYPGYGKSEGKIKSREQLYGAIQSSYDEVKKRFSEDSIIVLGYSIGTGPAAYLASTNQPRMLILQAPYYSMPDLMRHTYPFIPTFLLKYKFRTNEYLKKCKMPVVIFHGDQDEVIYYGSALKLKSEFKPGDTLITLSGQGHNGMSDNPEYIREISKILK